MAEKKSSIHLEGGAERSVWSLTFSLLKALGIDENSPNLIDAYNAIEEHLKEAEDIPNHAAEFWRRHNREDAERFMQSLGLPNNFQTCGLQQGFQLLKLYQELVEELKKNFTIYPDHTKERPSIAYGHPSREEWFRIVKCVVAIEDFINTVSKGEQNGKVVTNAS